MRWRTISRSSFLRQPPQEDQCEQGLGQGDRKRAGTPAKQAEAIVKYRDERGCFKSAEELKQVPGIDMDRVDAKIGMMEF
jgi:competence ComEA-like helix-hairpin-helix protein